ncbi:MAG: LarC family nickel insertion protein [Betaproteobacteria bacterium]|jgi:hypothetical protein|nr:LarC family nickel insertion protein [Rhodocyclaceae bacterium]MCA3134156.1 LarC family nickel insertion protein [Rhodocyclaceae bacterium]MCA3142552.1 LarC family nickel insertion protein [Rhodocyclaceae bacterium]MCA3144301.1 LarC family nickel insertion protein [Rhodocyclaceae bacterium]MCE2897365.1 LarC family nickel insertion protein [Betaproteobacteria bacterium]
MVSHIHLDAVGGVAGDMFIAAVTDAFAHLREGVLAAVRAAGLPAEVACAFEAHADHALTGSRFRVDVPVPGHGHVHRLHHHHAHRDFADIRTHLLSAPLDAEVKRRAVDIFTRLAEVEGRIHGKPTELVSFHELGEWDSIADIVGAAWLIHATGAQSWSIGTLPLGSGFVKTAHGKLPVPVPAAAMLLEGYAFADDGVAGERVTPTGAAIVRHLGCTQARPRGALRLGRTGHGFGTRVLPGLSNVLRVVCFEPVDADSDAADAPVAVIVFEVDDQTPEDLAIALDHLRSHPAVVDVLHSPVVGKKGRIAASIQVLADPAQLHAVTDACFLETATIGLRYQVVHRKTLPRDLRMVLVGNHAVRVKVVQRPQAATAKAESDDTAQVEGLAGRAALRRAAEDEGLE